LSDFPPFIFFEYPPKTEATPEKRLPKPWVTFKQKDYITRGKLSKAIPVTFAIFPLFAKLFYLSVPRRELKSRFPLQPMIQPHHKAQEAAVIFTHNKRLSAEGGS
jgi:hypothetical protein